MNPRALQPNKIRGAYQQTPKISTLTLPPRTNPHTLRGEINLGNEMTNTLKDFAGKTVLITGHTGFKGSWLSFWLHGLGAKVHGYSIDIPTEPSFFKALDLENKIEQHHLADIRDYQAFSSYLNEVQPDYVFHLAAQPIVSTSYENPVETISTNVMGMTHVLEALRHYEKSCTAVLITSDKCYDNVEWLWGYRENDHLGGKDIYSGSKGCAELVFKSYAASFFDNQDTIKLSTTRAGNVIGGGDWAKDRIIPDCVTSWTSNEAVLLRHPHATRPWQHVLEPLGGYLTLALQLDHDQKLHGESFNFGPGAEVLHSVEQVVKDLAPYFEQSVVNLPKEPPAYYESTLLKLNCDKALALLRWKACLNYAQTIEWVGEWYQTYYQNPSEIASLTTNQIQAYQAQLEA